MDPVVKGSVVDFPAVQAETPRGLQPFLHDACLCVSAPALVLSRLDGQIMAGADGFFRGDRRFLSRLELRFDNIPLASLGGHFADGDQASFRAVLRGVGERTPDPATTVHRSRRLHADRLEERIELANAGADHVSVAFTVAAGTDFAVMEKVKGGRDDDAAQPTAVPDGLDWVSGASHTALRSTPAPQSVDADGGLLRYQVQLAPGTGWVCTLVCTAEDAAPDLFLPVDASSVPWRETVLTSADRRFDRLVKQSVSDARHLLLADGAAPADVFLAAGAPWFLTLFGRDSLWAARMLLPLGTGLAAGTLRTLARRQGSRTDAQTGEEPGKILHEVRRKPSARCRVRRCRPATTERSTPPPCG